MSGREGINGISNIEVSKALGLSGGASLNLGALLQQHDIILSQGNNGIEKEYLSGKKTPPRHEDDAGKNTQQQALALSDIKLSMQANINTGVPRQNGLANSDIAQLQGSSLLG
jgi:hypothetical protein